MAIIKEELRLTDLIEVSTLQKMQDAFAAMTGVAVITTDSNGVAVTEPSDFSNVREKLEEAEIEFLEAEVQMVPTTTVSLDEKGVEKMERLIERLEDLDDVANIYHNWEE